MVIKFLCSNLKHLFHQFYILLNMTKTKSYTSRYFIKAEFWHFQRCVIRYLTILNSLVCEVSNLGTSCYGRYSNGSSTSRGEAFYKLISTTIMFILCELSRSISSVLHLTTFRAGRYERATPNQRVVPSSAGKVPYAFRAEKSYQDCSLSV